MSSRAEQSVYSQWTFIRSLQWSQCILVQLLWPRTHLPGITDMCVSPGELRLPFCSEHSVFLAVGYKIVDYTTTLTVFFFSHWQFWGGKRVLRKMRARQSVYAETVMGQVEHTVTLVIPVLWIYCWVNLGLLVLKPFGVFLKCHSSVLVYARACMHSHTHTLRHSRLMMKK